MRSWRSLRVGFGVLIAAAAWVSPVWAQTDPVASYAFDEISGTTASDATGNGRTGTVRSGTWTTDGYFGGGLTFNGTNTWVTVADHASLDLRTAMTLEAWVRPTALSGWRTVVMKEAAGQLAYTLYAHDDVPRPAAYVNGGLASETTVAGTSGLPLNTWTHLATTYDGTMLRLYVNGVEVSARPLTAQITATSKPLRIGGNSVWGEYFRGTIDEVRIYARALTAAQIQADMATPVGGVPDSTPPEVSVTAPVSGTVVNGTISLTASASDNIGVAGVKFLVDGNLVGSEDTTSPYAVQLDSRSLSNGAHVITASARDAAGNVTTSANVDVTASNPPLLVLVTPAPGASVSGPQVNVTYTEAGDLTGVDHVHFVLDSGPVVMDLTMDGNYSFANVAPGPHTLNGWLVHADHSKIDGSDAAPRSFVVTAPDTTVPQVTISAPAGGASVTGTIQVTATATDDVGVAGVLFLLDGSPLGSEDNSSPYAVSWNTGTIAAGTHVLTASARDAAGNLGASAPVTVTVVNPNDPAAVGQWAAPFDLGIVAINTVLLHTGSVLMASGSFSGSSFPERLWNPVTNSFADVPNGRTNLFCAGQSQLADGRILFIGGHDITNGILGDAGANIFDPVSQTWSAAPNMSSRRWYPTATTLADGRVLATSGGTTCLTCIADTPEVYDPRTNKWSSLTSARLSVPYYPFMYQLPDGRVLDAGANEQTVATRALNVASGAWTTIDPVIVDGHSSVMYRPGEILKSGTATDSGGTVPVTSTAYVLNMNAPTPQWRQVSPMAFPRAFHNLVSLPTGDVLAVGGGTQADGYDVNKAVMEAELWSPTTESWSTMARMSVPRLYHSTGLLLPDGRVLSAGSGMDGPAVNQTRGQIYSPPYLFRGPRPAITGAPELIPYAANFAIDTPDAPAISSVALVRPGAVTHSFNEDQRYVPLTFTAATGQLQVSAPANGNVAPPGYYMLFIVANGVPSVATWVRLPGPGEDIQPPSTPSGVAAISATGGVSLSWNAATDDTGVIAYNVHRGTTSGFAPSAANRVARVSGTSYFDFVPSGTYYYRVTAEDAAGQVSTPSIEVSGFAFADVTAPTVSITSPSAGATVSQTVNIAASAADDVGVASVQFNVDGAALTPTDMAPPFSVAWLTTGAANGPHSLTAVARDNAGNATESAPVTVTVSNTAVPAGLVAAYGFDEGAGATAVDASGNGNSGSIAGATWVTTGKFGAALRFNGTSGMVSVADAATLDLTNRLTLEAWVQPTAEGGWRTVILKERPSGLVYSLYGDENNTGPAGYLTISGDKSVTSTGALPLNAWTHIAFTYDGATMRLYVNGVQVKSRAQTGSTAVSSGMLRIGGNTVWGEYFAGLIDEVRLYNRALSAAEIQADMNTAVTH
jgi:hypothetical protein